MGLHICSQISSEVWASLRLDRPVSSKPVARTPGTTGRVGHLRTSAQSQHKTRGRHQAVPWWGRGARQVVLEVPSSWYHLRLRVICSRTARAHYLALVGDGLHVVSRPHGRTGTASAREGRGAPGVRSGLGQHHPTPGPSVLDKTVTAWRGSQCLEPQQAGRAEKTFLHHQTRFSRKTGQWAGGV